MRSHAGAVGIMQLLPSTAADPNVGIPDIEDKESNIHAGIKYMDFLRSRYFDDPAISDLDQLLLSLAAAGATYLLANWLPRRMDRGKQHRPNSTWVRRKLSFWPYLIGGCVCWYGFQESGIHPALGLLPMVLTIPHADVSFGIFAEAETHLHDLLNEIEHGLKAPVEVVLFLFGLANAGVEFTSMGNATWLVLAGLLIGKPLGITLMGVFAAKGLKLGLPEGMRMVDLFVVGCVAAIGFTVALFVAAVAFDPGPVQDAAKMGALMSFGAAILSIIAGKVTRVQKKVS